LIFIKQIDFLIISIITAFIICLQIEIWSSDLGFGYGKNITSQITQSQLLKHNLQKNNLKIEQQIAKLQNSEAILEMHARKLGFVKSNETFYSY